jgi:hypothetical protein
VVTTLPADLATSVVIALIRMPARHSGCKCCATESRSGPGGVVGGKVGILQLCGVNFDEPA